MNEKMARAFRKVGVNKRRDRRRHLSLCKGQKGRAELRKDLGTVLKSIIELNDRPIEAAQVDWSGMLEQIRLGR